MDRSIHWSMDGRGDRCSIISYPIIIHDDKLCMYLSSSLVYPLAAGLPDDRGWCYVAHPRGGWGGRGHCGCGGFNRRPGKRGGDGDDGDDGDGGDGGYGSGILRICEPSKRLVLQWCLLDTFRYVYTSITRTHTNIYIYIYIYTHEFEVLGDTGDESSWYIYM